MAETLKLSAPWVIYFRELKALFGDDPAINVTYDEDNMIIKLFVVGASKADAIAQLLPTEKTFGNVTVKIAVIPANALGESKMTLFQKAFDGNPAVSYLQSIPGLYNNELHYVVFEPEVVQYYNDSLGDINCIESTLYQDIAKRVFGEQDGIFFCTDKKN